MKQIASQIEGKQAIYGDLMETLGKEGFTLSNWEYRSGFLDRKLDDKGMVFLRLPVQVVSGELDQPHAVLRFEQPFVLKHIYQTGSDDDIDYAVVSSMFNQFQEPINKDADIESIYITQAEELLRRLEQTIFAGE
ncbi:YugN family protein [Brevibacillus laterosporus]|uniref:YugN family protein n=1 Tax=Brevibacillus laterosporus TaxID=1465 RepID=UPI00112C236C|nr:YugN family protein [Brevibacillus laterosporus]MBG9803077.1 hypothetical protein [Brevibacillus laterosporus]MED4762911.1 YugN family protein [Brevibacillus laterosporus]TPH22867.1 hypothetical protein EGH09_01390 [Brevibacillus laterosporus]